MIKHADLNDRDLRGKIRHGEICFAGNSKLKIYGILQCKSGKRMKQPHRVFFTSEEEAIQNGFRPCGHCKKTAYEKWKLSNFDVLHCKSVINVISNG